MKFKDKIIFTAFIFVVLCWLIYLIKSVLTPFVFSFIIAYFLDPLVEYLTSKYKLSRSKATLLIMALFIGALVTISSFLLPIIYTQFLALIGALPGYFQIIADDIYPKIAATLNKAGIHVGKDFSHLMQDGQINDRFVELSQNIFSNVLSSSIALVNILSLIFVMPILVFYLLRDWNLLIAKANNFLPRNIASSVKKIALEIDETLSGYLRGQLNVCLILSAVYASLLSLTGINFGFLIGFITGIFSFVPYVGMLVGIAAATIIGLLQWGFDGTHIALVTAAFVAGNIIETNFLVPKLIGSKVGLHPVWLIFGLFAFGALFGFVGVLIAVPLTAICGVVIRYFATSYKNKFT